MRIVVVGTGYVGLVTGSCFAEMGNTVLCVDADEGKIERLRQGQVPIHESGLEPMIRRNVAVGRLVFSTSYDEAVAHGDVFFIAVGTPSDEDGSADLSHVVAAARSIGSRVDRPVLVVNKSTVPVGTADAVRSVFEQELAARGLGFKVSVASNPEFLKEGAAVEDCMRPERVIVGTDDPVAEETLRALYAPFGRNHEKLIVMDVRSAELTKYAANAMLATRISFMNEMANLADSIGADIEAVRRGIGSDGRIGPHFLYSGAGYGGSCFPKDVKALLKSARDVGHELRVVGAVEQANEVQKGVLFKKIVEHYGGQTALRGKVFGLWGLAFKANTDDMREAPSIALIGQLAAAGARVRAYDPAAREQAERVLGGYLESKSLTIVESAVAAVGGANELAVVTEWQEFRSPDFAGLANRLADRVVFDGRNLYDPELVVNAGLVFHGIGRGGRARAGELPLQRGTRRRAASVGP